MWSFLTSGINTLHSVQYNTWAGFDGDSDQFWTNEKTRQMYKDHLNVVVNRVNTLNGKPGANWMYEQTKSKCLRQALAYLFRMHVW